MSAGGVRVPPTVHTRVSGAPGGLSSAPEQVPSGLPHLLNWAEGNQSLGETLHLIAGMFESRARAYSNTSASLVAIIIVTCVVITIGVVAASLLVPMISLISKLSG